MSLTIHTKKQGRLSKRNWMPTSIPAESFRTFAHGISALHIFDHGTKGRLTWYAIWMPVMAMNAVNSASARIPGWHRSRRRIS